MGLSSLTGGFLCVAAYFMKMNKLRGQESESADKTNAIHICSLIAEVISHRIFFPWLEASH